MQRQHWRLLIALTLAVVDSPSFAAMNSVADDHSVWLVTLKKIGDARGLSERDNLIAQRTAATFYYVWPCQGDARKVDDAINRDAMSAIVNPSPDIPLAAAFSEMVAAFVGWDLGRPRTSTCNFALEIARKPTP